MTLPTIPGYTAEDLAALAPEELSALQSDAGTDEDVLKEIVGDEADTETDGKPAAADTGADAKPGKDGKPAEAAAGDDKKPEEKPGAEAAADEPPVKVKAFVAEAPADAEAQLEAAKAAKAAAKTADKEALKKLHDGEIDFEEYQKVKDAADADIEKANDTISTVKQAINNAEISQNMTQQELAAAWQAEVAATWKAAKAEGIDYKAKGNEALHKEFDGLVRAFGAEATAAGVSDENLVASKQALKQAHEVMKMRHPELVKAAPAAAAGKEGVGKDGKPGEKPAAAARHELTTLGGMPNADRALGDNDAVQKLGSLEGEELERALATMSTAEVDKIMASV